MKKDEKKPLSAAQVKYMQARLNEIKIAKMRAINKEFEGEDNLGDVLTEEIQAGRVKLVPGKLAKASGRTDLADVLYFEKYRGTAQTVSKAVSKVVQKRAAEAEARKDQVRDEMAKILDQVMLGDADQALKMLEDFTAKSF